MPSGTLDPTFGVGGLAKTDFGELTDQANAIALQGDGKIVAAGSSGDRLVHFALSRYNSNGSLDSTFGTAGLVVTTIDVADQINSVAIQADEKIVAAGWSAPVAGDESENDFALTRYNPDASLDTSFGSGGKVSTDFGGGGDVASALLLQPDGRIVAGGSTGIPGTGSMDFAVARYNTVGSLDSSFGSGGEVTTDFGELNPTFDVATSLLLHSDGGLLAVGYSRQNGLTGSLDLAIARYRTNGTLEPSFASGGKVITDLEGTDDQAYAAALPSNGKIIVVGVTERMGGFDWAVLRYLPGGTLDASFGSNGVCTTDGEAGSDMARGVIVQTDGTLVAAGGSSGIGGGDFALAHYYADGTLDPSFGSGGKVTTDFLGGLDGANAAILQPDDKVLVVGTYAAPGEAQFEHGGFAVARYNTDGSLDSTFGSGGKVTTDLAGGYSGGGTANAVVLQADGKIVVAGTRWVGDCTRFCVVSFALRMSHASHPTIALTSAQVTPSPAGR